jgi:hypothetical protein
MRNAAAPSEVTDYQSWLILNKRELAVFDGDLGRQVSTTHDCSKGTETVT